MIRTALIGVSGYAETYLAHLLRLRNEEKIDLVAVCINNPDQCEKQIASLNEIECQIFSSTEEMYASTNDLEWCCIPTGIDSHKHLAIEAFENGCHVLLEKPISGRLEDIEQIQRAAEKAERMIMIGYQDLYNPDIREIKQILINKNLGDLESIKVIGMWPRSVQHYERNHWAGKKRVGDNLVLDSPLHNAFAHFINLMCFWGGASLESSAQIEKAEIDAYRAIDIENFDTCSLRLRTDSGAVLLAWITHACKENVNPKIEIKCSSGKILWDMDKYFILKDDEYEIGAITGGLVHARKRMFNCVAEHIKYKDMTVCGIDQATAPTIIANMINETVEIKTIAKEFCDSEETDFGTQVSIQVIEELAGRGFDEGKLFSELESDWS